MSHRRRRAADPAPAAPAPAAINPIATAIQPREKVADMAAWLRAIAVDDATTAGDKRDRLLALREEGELRGALEQLVASELVFVRGAPGIS